MGVIPAYNPYAQPLTTSLPWAIVTPQGIACQGMDEIADQNNARFLLTVGPFATPQEVLALNPLDRTHKGINYLDSLPRRVISAVIELVTPTPQDQFASSLEPDDVIRTIAERGGEWIDADLFLALTVLPCFRARFPLAGIGPEVRIPRPPAAVNGVTYDAFWPILTHREITLGLRAHNYQFEVGTRFPMIATDQNFQPLITVEEQ